MAAKRGPKKKGRAGPGRGHKKKTGTKKPAVKPDKPPPGPEPPAGEEPASKSQTGGEAPEIPKRGPGRPKDSKTKDKPGAPVPRAPRRTPRDTVDLDHAIPREHERLNALYDEYNQRHGTNIAPLPEKMGEINKPRVVPPPGACGAALGSLCEIMGQMWEVEARPTPQALAAADKAWMQFFEVFTIDPRYLVAGGAIGATMMCALPMYQERRLVKSGALPPASERQKTTEDK